MGSSGKSLGPAAQMSASFGVSRSEEHTSELQSQSNLVCRLLLEKKNHHVPARATADGPRVTGGARVLVVDDKPQILRGLRGVLRNTAFQVAVHPTRATGLYALSG